MDFQDIKNQSEKELRRLLGEQRDLLRELKFQVGEGQLKDVSKIKKTRKIIAQILTLLSMKKQTKQRDN